MPINIDTIKALRGLTSAGIMDCKSALEESDGDIAKAEEILRSKGIASAIKKSTRETNQGLVESYIHSGGRIGAIVEANCETDFVARTDDFKALAHNLAMQVAAMAPKYVDVSDIPDGDQENVEEVCLLQQPFIKDPSLSVQDLVREAAGKLGENVQVRRFTRFALGE
ncbi:MAG: translation elongation factor Ts [SAR202 cluster bacterium]|jgi:elongation factor Ts|nr:translation elongation factor Ts [SAR202 cluster bacterium]|tara:strand:+ start:183 stop:686 length:504 start_codon:yes stop_codon:yes gene_type:complete